MRCGSALFVAKPVLGLWSMVCDSVTLRLQRWLGWACARRSAPSNPRRRRRSGTVPGRKSREFVDRSPYVPGHPGVVPRAYRAPQAVIKSACLRSDSGEVASVAAADSSAADALALLQQPFLTQAPKPLIASFYTQQKRHIRRVGPGSADRVESRCKVRQGQARQPSQFVAG